jgi:hypothetical protein
MRMRSPLSPVGLRCIYIAAGRHQIYCAEGALSEGVHPRDHREAPNVVLEDLDEYR